MLSGRTGNVSSQRGGIAKGDGNEEGQRGKKILQLTPNNSNMPANSNLALTPTKVNFPEISFLPLL